MSGKDFMERFQEKSGPIEETHKRATFLIERELLERLDKLSSNRARGFKTAIINEALRRILDEIEGNQQ